MWFICSNSRMEWACLCKWPLGRHCVGRGCPLGKKQVGMDRTSSLWTSSISHMERNITDSEILSISQDVQFLLLPCYLKQTSEYRGCVSQATWLSGGKPPIRPLSQANVIIARFFDALKPIMGWGQNALGMAHIFSNWGCCGPSNGDYIFLKGGYCGIFLYTVWYVSLWLV